MVRHLHFNQLDWEEVQKNKTFFEALTVFYQKKNIFTNKIG